jgi:hypothetical protein
LLTLLGLLCSAGTGCVIASADDDGMADTDGGTDGGTTSDTDADQCPTPPTGDEPPEVLGCGAFNEDVVLVNHPERPVDYVVDCRANVSNHLSIEAGTVIEFEPEAGLAITGDGGIEAIGDACNPVVLRGTTEGPGAWNGVMVYSDDEANRLEFVEMHGAGGGAFNSNGDLGSLLLYSGGVLTVRDSLLADGAAYGFNANYGSNTLTWERNVVTGHAQPAVRIVASEAGALDPDSEFIDNPGGDYIEVVGEQLASEVTWRALSVHYQVIADTVVRSVDGFTIEAGTQILFETDAGLSGSPGRLHLDGDPDRPIVLDGVDPQPGFWRGVFIQNESPSNRIEHTEIHNGGGHQFNSNGDLGGLIVYGSTALTLANTTVANSAAMGLNATYPETSLTFEGTNTFTGNAGPPIWVGAYLAHAVTPETEVTDNPGGDFVYVWASDIEGAQEWEALSVPYRISYVNQRDVRTTSGNALTILPGAELRFEDETGVASIGGSLDILGEEGNEVRLLGAEEVPGYWKGILVQAAGQPVSYAFDQVEIAHAGGGAFNSNGDLGTIIVWGSTAVSITNVDFHDNAAGCVINAPYPEDDLSLGGNTFTDNAGDGVCDGP